MHAPRRTCYVSTKQEKCYAHGDKIKSSPERSCVAVALNLAMMPVTIIAHSLLRRLVSHIGGDLLSSGLMSGSVGRALTRHSKYFPPCGVAAASSAV